MPDGSASDAMRLVLEYLLTNQGWLHPTHYGLVPSEEMGPGWTLNTLAQIGFYSQNIVLRYNKRGREADGFDGVIFGYGIELEPHGTSVRITIYGPEPGTCPTLIKDLADGAPDFVSNFEVGTIHGLLEPDSRIYAN